MIPWVQRALDLVILPHPNRFPNPLYWRLVKRHAFLEKPLRRLLLILLASTASIMGIGLGLANGDNPLYYPMAIYGLYLFIPAICGVLTFDLIRHEHQSRTYELMALTLLYREQIVAGYYRAMIYRMRWLIGCGILILGALNVVVFRAIHLSAQADRLATVWPVVFILTIDYALGGLPLLAIALGLWSGFQWQHHHLYQSVVAASVIGYVTGILVTILLGLVSSTLIFIFPLLALAQGIQHGIEHRQLKAIPLTRTTWI